MSKVKQAREALEAVELAPKASRKREVCQILFYVQHKDTILTALKALERMQGVDFDGLAKAFSRNETWEFNTEQAEIDFGHLVNAAQTLADIKKEVEE